MICQRQRNNTSNEMLLAMQNERESNARSYPRRLPIAIKQAKGAVITDMDGKEYIDCLAGAALASWS